MKEIVKTEKAKHASATYGTHCPNCGCEVWFTEDDCYDPGRIGGELTCIICPNCKKEIEL